MPVFLGEPSVYLNFDVVFRFSYLFSFGAFSVRREESLRTTHSHIHRRAHIWGSCTYRIWMERQRSMNVRSHRSVQWISVSSQFTIRRCDVRFPFPLCLGCVASAREINSDEKYRVSFEYCTSCCRSLGLGCYSSLWLVVAGQIAAEPFAQFLSLSLSFACVRAVYVFSQMVRMSYAHGWWWFMFWCLFDLEKSISFIFSLFLEMMEIVYKLRWNRRINWNFFSYPKLA